MALIFAFPLLRLGIYHLAIIRKKRTTNEDLKNIYSSKIELPFDSCYIIDRKRLFTTKTNYFMDKNHKSESSKEIKKKGENEKMKLILLGSLNR